ncbi:hypothetical protein HN51_012774 [Arachis hypogaea]|uniref:PH domain-containing protein n=1 Tax=Arachis hypogaea TaxID=3818 RepID=A0A445DSY2_ARAHY|nr:oxysterol-binding protein-related protein 1B-like [Arachis hypogaea]QHO58345.1 Oxysterol-binding protein-related protein 1C [Arachis hypogaea]RYR66292.1 hypothetical protein Ahy_A03g012276 [Arachis hypogaea]
METSTASFRSLGSFSSDRIDSARFSRSNTIAADEYRLGEIIENNNNYDNGITISGMLYKWVNYAQGWRPRWFILEDGVLSYYKMETHNLLLTPSAAKIVGQESLRRFPADIRCTSRQSQPQPEQPLGQFHLRVCTARENKSDGKRFCVYTGTKKKIHLKAENKEDRATWLEALQVVKNSTIHNSNTFFSPRSSSSVVVTTHRLRQRLLEEGLTEAAIQDSEDIMRTELSHVLNNNHLHVLDTTEDIDLQNPHIKSKSQNSRDDANSYRTTYDNNSEGSVSDRDAFFDTFDILSTCSESSTGFQPYRFGLDLEHEDVSRRKKLPDPVEKDKGVSLWSIIKDNIGKDLTRICLPVYFNEPLSSLQKCLEDLEYSYLLDQAYAWGKMGNNVMRMICVAAFAVSGYACTDGRTCKPFNPLLGETYEALYPEKGIRFISEKVSHHPMILACHCEGRGWTIWGDSNLKSKFWGRSIHLDPVGVITLQFDDGDVFQWSKVTTAIYNLILGKLYCDHYGTMRIKGNRDYSCMLKFKEQSIIERNPHQVRGVVEDKEGKKVATVYGKWNESLQYEILENSSKGEVEGSNESSKSHLIWKKSEPSEYQTRYNLTKFAITLNEITPELKEKLPPTDSRLRPDQRCLENGEYEKANAEKLRLEQRQRQARKVQEKGWKPRWFAMDKNSHTYCYVGGYWEAREKGNWEACHDIFGQLPTNDTDTDIDK